MTNSREALWAAFRAEIQALSEDDLAALIASFEADPEPGLDDAKLTELYAERDRRMALLATWLCPECSNEFRLPARKTPRRCTECGARLVMVS